MAQVVAALSLYEQNLAYAARANIRVALEHALAAQWVVHTYEGEDALIGSMSRLHRNVVRSMRDGGVVIPQKLQADLNHPVGEPQLKIEAVADRFDGGTKSIYGLYRQLTGAVHVSLATLATYIEWRGEDQPPALRLAPELDPDPDQLLALGWSSMLALNAIEGLRSGQPYVAKSAISRPLTSWCPTWDRSTLSRICNTRRRHRSAVRNPSRRHASDVASPWAAEVRNRFALRRNAVISSLKCWKSVLIDHLRSGSFDAGIVTELRLALVIQVTFSPQRVGSSMPAFAGMRLPTLTRDATSLVLGRG